MIDRFNFDLELSDYEMRLAQRFNFYLTIYMSITIKTCNIIQIECTIRFAKIKIKSEHGSYTDYHSSNSSIRRLLMATEYGKQTRLIQSHAIYY